MSTTKKTTKKPVTEAAETGDGAAIKIKDHSAFAVDKDGNVREATPEETAQAKAALITVVCSDGEGGEVAKTYDCFIKNHENGNISLAIRTSDTLEDKVIDNPNPCDMSKAAGVKDNKKITLVGRGNPLGASFALVNCYRAYGSPFGQQFSHRLVRMVLDRELKIWRGLFVPAMTIAAM